MAAAIFIERAIASTVLVGRHNCWRQRQQPSLLAVEVARVHGNGCPCWPLSSSAASSSSHCSGPPCWLCYCRRPQQQPSLLVVKTANNWCPWQWPSLSAVSLLASIAEAILIGHCCPQQPQQRPSSSAIAIASIHGSGHPDSCLNPDDTDDEDPVERCAINQEDDICQRTMTLMLLFR